jgi:hypothetical protein
VNWIAVVVPLWRLLRPLWAPLAGWLKGRHDARVKAELDAARAAMRAEAQRRRIDNAVATTDDLADLARRTPGFVRPDDK